VEERLLSDTTEREREREGKGTLPGRKVVDELFALHYGFAF